MLALSACRVADPETDAAPPPHGTWPHAPGTPAATFDATSTRFDMVAVALPLHNTNRKIVTLDVQEVTSTLA
jgi:hypothetical protein